MRTQLKKNPLKVCKKFAQTQKKIKISCQTDYIFFEKKAAKLPKSCKEKFARSPYKKQNLSWKTVFLQIFPCDMLI